MPASHSCTPVHWRSTSTTAFPIRRPVPHPGNFGMANNFSTFLPETTIGRRSAFTPSQSGRSFPSKGATRGVPGETYFEHLDLWSDGHPCGPHAVELYTMSVHQHQLQLPLTTICIACRGVVCVMSKLATNSGSSISRLRFSFDVCQLKLMLQKKQQKMGWSVVCDTG